MSKPSLWAVRLIVLGAFAATVWLCGPRAAAVLAAKLDGASRPGPRVALDRVGFAERPDWLDQPLLVAVAEAVSPWLSDEVGILDEATARRVRDGLETVPWVCEASIERLFPDRFRVQLALRRPVLAVRSGDDDPLCLVDKDGVVLPWVDTPLPVLRLYREGGSPTMSIVPGEASAEARVRVAAAIACEWRDELAPLVDGCPALDEIDATNLGERWIRGPEYPEVRVTLVRHDGAPVVFGYGRPVDSPMPRVPVRSKAHVLQQILGRHPGLDGLVAGDLRFVRRWADYLQPRAPGVRDPNGPWKELVPVPAGR